MPCPEGGVSAGRRAQEGRSSLTELAAVMTDPGYVPVDVRLTGPVDVTLIGKTTDVVFVHELVAGSVVAQPLEDGPRSPDAH